MIRTAKFWCIRLIGFLCCAAAISVYAADASKYINQAKQYQQKGEYRAAIIQLKNALQQDANQSQARIMLAQSYLKIGGGASAEKELKLAKELGAEPAQVLPLLGQAYIQQQKYKQILDEIKPDEITSPQSRATLLALQGDAYLGLGKRTEALQKYSAALKLDSDSEAALLGQTRAALLHNETSAATKQIDDLVKRFPRSADVWVMKGELHRQRSEFSAGAAAFEKAATYLTASMARSDPSNATRILRPGFSIQSSFMQFAIK